MRAKVLVLDVGVGRHGYEIQWLAKEIFPALGIVDYQIHGFEACLGAWDAARSELVGLKAVVWHLAISDREGTCRLYHAINPDGHSIFASKDNVVDASRDYEDVQCSRLSVWLASAGVDPDQYDIRILRFNVEGAEWPLFVDLEVAGLLRKFQIVCGNCGGDIQCVRELDGCYQQFLAIAARNGIEQFWFCYDTVHDEQAKAEMRARLSRLLGEVRHAG